MDINEMNLMDVEERLASLDTEVRESQDVDFIKKATEEKKALLERKAELKDLEERKAQAEALTRGEVIAEKIIEVRKETKTMEKTFAIDSAEYRNAWLKDLMGKELDVEERTAMTGTYAIPTETLNKIVTRLQENPLLAKIDLLQIPGYVRIPVYSTNNDATWTTSSTDSEDVIGKIDLTPYQLIKTIEVPATVDKMSISAFEAYIVKALANKIEVALQKAVIVGTGSSQPKGIVTEITTATGTFTRNAATKKDLLSIMGSLPADYQNGACWIMPAAVFYGEVMNISNHDSFVNVNDGFTYKLFGKDVILDDSCIVGAAGSTVDNILYGNPKAYHMNMGETIKIDKDMSVGFRSNSAVYRAVCLADGKLDNAAAFVRYERAAS